MAESNKQLDAIRKDVQETLKIVLLINRSLQSFKQEALIRFDAHDKEFALVHGELKDLKKLIFKGDQALVKFLIEREREIQTLTQQVQALTQRVYVLEQRGATAA